MPTKDGKLTRSDMENIIAQGGSVLLPNRRIVNDPAHLPTDADLAKGDAARSAQVAAALDQQIANLAAQCASLTAGTAPAADADPNATPAPARGKKAAADADPNATPAPARGKKAAADADPNAQDNQ